ncbi:MAG: tRNA1(Val) (adenine(37)-N6)-methyltransferase [Nitrospirota bacterium]
MDVTLDSIRDVRLYQSRTGYRFSVDSLLLYEFVDLKNVSNIADLGAGSGIVGILLAKRYPQAKVTLFEIQDSLIALAQKNVALNNLRGRVTTVKCDISELSRRNARFGSYDLVVSNPPFRRLKSGRINLEEERAIARHEIKLGLSEFIDAAARILRARGRLCLIYHPWRLAELVERLKKRGMEPKRIRFVHSRISSEAKMVLLEAVKTGKTGMRVENPFFIYDEKGQYTEEMGRVYKPEVGIGYGSEEEFCK